MGDDFCCPDVGYSYKMSFYFYRGIDEYIVTTIFMVVFLIIRWPCFEEDFINTIIILLYYSLFIKLMTH